MNAVVDLNNAAENGRDLRAEVVALQKADSKLSQAEISRQSGIDDGRLSQWIRGIYPGDNPRIEAEIERWIDNYKERQLRARMLPGAPAWQPTPSAQKIIAALGYAQVAARIVIIYGGAGVGKSETAKHYHATNPNVFRVEMRRDCSNLVPALQEIAEELGTPTSGGARAIARAIIKRLRGTKGLLVIDEAQHLGLPALDGLRGIYDAAGIGMALMGNEEIYARMVGTRAAYLDRLFSRIAMKERITRSTRADIDLVIDAWKLKHTDCRKILHEIAGKPGALRDMTNVLQLATMSAGGGVPCCDDIKAAWRKLAGGE